MNEQELKAYALRGLTARLTELDEERARILVLLESWDTAAKPTVRRRSRNVPRQSAPIDPTEALVAIPMSSSPLPVTAELEVARILPRRNRTRARPTVVETVPAPALPPMPRLVKFRAS